VKFEEKLIAELSRIYRRPMDFRCPPAPKTRKHKIREEAVLQVSDIQLGKKTKSYNTGVARQRLHRLAQKTVSITETRRNSFQVDTLNLLILGDIVEGEVIFPGQPHQIDSSVFAQACRNAPEMLVEMVMYLLEHFKKINIVCVSGNHGRPAARSAGSHKESNWDNVVYEVMKLMLLGTDDNPHKDIRKRVSFQFDPLAWYQVATTMGHGILCIHGDQVKSSYAGIPWYGISRRAKGWFQAVREEFHYMMLGHFHTWATFVDNQLTIMVNGTTESDNVYAQSLLASMGVPCQRLCFFNKKHGLSAEFRVLL
jgi:hypothetical protein